MAQYYQKINTLYKRGEKNQIIEGDFSMDEFTYLKNCLWETQEKLDGTNMSYHVFFDTELGAIKSTEIHGKTENAKIPEGLLAEMKKIFDPLVSYGHLTETFKQVKNLEDGTTVTTWPYKVVFYGEGYGAKIQSGGRYSPTEKFTVFDISIQGVEDGSEIYLLRDSVVDICDKLKLDLVYSYGHMTIAQAEKIIKDIAALVYTVGVNNITKDSLDKVGYDPYFIARMFSNHSIDKNLIIEGFVLKSPIGLMTRLGKPLVLKIKVKDYVDLMRKKNIK